METSVLHCCLLFLLFSPAVPICLPTDFTMYVEKPECNYCVAVNTTICEGFCFSWDSNKRFLRKPLQTRCAYHQVEYHSIVLPGCPAGTNAIFTYPVALSCRCAPCSTESVDCTHRSSGRRNRCTEPDRPVYFYPDPIDPY